jgi:hypothetical protein
MAQRLAIDDSGIAAIFAVLVMLYCGIKRLCLLQALAANRGIQVVAGKKSFSALGAL